MPLVVLSVTICLDNTHLLSKKGKFEPYALIGYSTFFSKRVVSQLKRILLLFLIISFSLTTVISLITIIEGWHEIKKHFKNSNHLLNHYFLLLLNIASVMLHNKKYEFSAALKVEISEKKYATFTILIPLCFYNTENDKIHLL